MTAQKEDFILVPTTPEERREAAIQRIKAKHDFKVHLMIYLIINTMLVLIWAFTSGGASGARGFFWPMFPIFGWGIGVSINGYVAYKGNYYTEAQIEREMRNLPR